MITVVYMLFTEVDTGDPMIAGGFPLSAERWPKEGRVGICGKAPDPTYPDLTGQYILVTVATDDLWEIYFEKGDMHGISFTYSVNSLREFLDRARVVFIGDQDRESSAEAEIFGLRKYWRKRKIIPRDPQ